MGPSPVLSSNAAAARIDSFITRQGWAGAEKTYLAGDFSGRFYVRLRRGLGGEKMQALVMCVPETKDLEAFMHMQKLLQENGTRVPAIYGVDKLEDLALIEDLGDSTFSALSSAELPRFLKAGVDILLHLHNRAKGEKLQAETIPHYTPQLFTEQVSLFAEMLENVIVKKKLSADAHLAFARLWPALLEQACANVPQSLLLRDYHGDNLMILRSDPPQLAVIDFQDGGIGPISYDLASLLEDARRHIHSDVRHELLDYYCKANPEISQTAFMASYHIMAAQRHLRVMAVTARRWATKGDAAVLDYYSRSWQLLLTHKNEPSLAPLFQWLDAHVPGQYRQGWRG